jgi:hypothetical protein
MHVVGRAARLILASAMGALAAAAWASETRTYSYDTLGRLVATASRGTVNNGRTTSIAYDPAGNRSCYAAAGAAAGAGGSCKPAGNQPPVANPDTAASIPKCGATSVDVTANDTDPEGNYPLTVTAASGAAALAVTVTGASTLRIESTGGSGVKSFSYTVRDSLGASSTGSGTITVTTTNLCS